MLAYAPALCAVFFFIFFFFGFRLPVCSCASSISFCRRRFSCTSSSLYSCFAIFFSLAFFSLTFSL